jgi:5-deoxy-glucuronate isomerase
MHDAADALHFRPLLRGDAPGVITRVTPAQAGWRLLTVEVRRLHAGQRWTTHTGEQEAVLVVLGGQGAAASNRGTWPHIGARPHVFAGKPHALYLPRQTALEIEATSPVLEIACGWAPTDRDYPARLVTPAEVQVELRGGASASRQIHSIVPPGFPCHRLVCVEVYTPGGNWSSYPPHKHDVHRVAPDGTVLEADLEEVYYYRFDRPEGFALQRLYTGDGALDTAVVARDHDIVLVPEGYHPVCAAFGYTCYYLNFLAGSAQSLANSEDPAHAWVKALWTTRDPRLPIVPTGGT